MDADQAPKRREAGQHDEHMLPLTAWSEGDGSSDLPSARFRLLLLCCRVPGALYAVPAK